MVICKVQVSYMAYEDGYKVKTEVFPLEVRESKAVYINEGRYGNGHYRKTDVEAMRYYSDGPTPASPTYGSYVAVCFEQDVERCKKKIKDDILFSVECSRDAFLRAFNRLEWSFKNEV
jgi:hypothetical protein